MDLSRASRAVVGEDLLLDGRLALFHKRDRWLAAADLHFGYEISQRAAGNLFPMWGMQTIQTRLEDLLRDYQPARLILLGDLVHDSAGGDELRRLIDQLVKYCEVVLIAGNHDRRLTNGIQLVDTWRSNGFCFHHGHCELEHGDEVQIIGHHHPAGVVRDGAGLRLRLPAFVQQENCWILPAFSPWAAGTEWPQRSSTRVWLCSPQRILCINPGSAGC